MSEPLTMVGASQLNGWGVHMFGWHDSGWVRADLINMIREDHVPIINTPGSCVIDHWQGMAMNAWRQHVLQCLQDFPERGDLHLYAVVSRPDMELTQNDWAPGYPHVHAYAYRSIVTYLDPGAGAPLVIQTADEPVVLRPVAGQTVVFDGSLKHGFHNWYGPPRVALVAQQVPQGMQRIGA